MASLKGKTVLITGASSGIGEALAHEYARRGAGVVLLARRLDRLEKLAATLRARGTPVWVFAADVSQENDLARVLPLVLAQIPSLDTVIANAGFGVAGTVERLTVADYDRQFQTNVYGVLRTFYATIDALKKSRGQFCIIGSVNGYLALPGNSAYGMSKYAVRALAESLRYEMKPFGVSVTHIAPGFVISEIRKVNNRGQLRETARDPIPKWLQCPAPQAARAIAHAVQRRVRERSITGHGWLAIRLARHFPALLHFLVSQIGVSARRQPA